MYSLRAKVTDLDLDDSGWVTNTDCFQVLNNPPGVPVVEIYPQNPRTGSDLTGNIISGSFDVEGEPLTYTYRWYKDNEVQLGSDTDTITAGLTSKGEVWKCEIIAFDGHDESVSAFDEVIIGNTPPDVVSSVNTVNMNEDQADWDSISLKDIFSDVDGDDLRFSAEGFEHIEVEIFQANGTVIIRPEENWFGTSNIRFFANDSLADASILITIEIAPTNDPPVMTLVGTTDPRTREISLVAYEDSYLNITLTGEDIDGDILSYGSNLTDGVGGDDRSDLTIVSSSGALSFIPGNDDVGVIHIMLWVKDPSGAIDMVAGTITVINKNDPPEITIVEPVAKAFNEGVHINFSATVSDIDEVWSPQALKITWSSNISNYIGEGLQLVGISTLQPGAHLITATVRDSEGLTASDSIVVTVHPKEVRDASQSGESEATQWWWWLVVLVIVVLVIVMLIILSRKDKKEETEVEPPGPSSMAPVSAEVIPISTHPIHTTRFPKTPTYLVAPDVTSRSPPTLDQTPPTTPLPLTTSTEPSLLLPKSTEDSITPDSTSGATVTTGPSPQDPLIVQKQRSVMMDHIERLGELKDQGLISEEEFAQQKQVILSQNQ